VVVPSRIARESGRFALVDGIPFEMPVNSHDTPALMAGFRIDAKRAAALLPGNELFPFRWGRSALLVVTVVDYRETNIGRYIEFSIAIACTHGDRLAPPIVPVLAQSVFGLGQYVYDLPVSTEISVKGGKGIWGMPKHRANLDFVIGTREASSQYDLDGEMVMRIDVARQGMVTLPLTTGGVNYCAFRGLLMKSSIYFRGKATITFFRPTSARLTLGDHPRASVLKDLQIDPRPLFSIYFPTTQGILDDHFESWFLSYATRPTTEPEGLESVVNLGLGEEWLPPPHRTWWPEGAVEATATGTVKA
jgi:Acetoacetate decarboxylase (ADC)